MSISGCDIPVSQSVRNLGFYLEETLSMDAHIKYLCRIPSDFPVLARCLKNCIEDVAEWLGDSKLKMNDDKT